MTDFKIESSGRRCVVTGRELKPGEKCFSVLRAEDGKFVRSDYSPEAWQGEPADAFSFWAGRVPGAEGRRRLTIDDDLLFDCFQKLEGQDQPSRQSFRYVLGLLLLRRKRLALQETTTEGNVELLTLREPKTGTRHRVVNPGLSDDETMRVQEDVFQALGWE